MAASALIIRAIPSNILVHLSMNAAELGQVAGPAVCIARTSLSSFVSGCASLAAKWSIFSVSEAIVQVSVCFYCVLAIERSKVGHSCVYMRNRTDIKKEFCRMALGLST